MGRRRGIPCTTRTSTFHSFAASSASATELTITNMMVLCALFASYACTWEIYFPRSFPNANHTAVGSSSSTGMIRGSADTSVLSRIQPINPTPTGTGTFADIPSFERTDCNVDFRVAEESKAGWIRGSMNNCGSGLRRTCGHESKSASRSNCHCQFICCCKCHWG